MLRHIRWINCVLVSVLVSGCASKSADLLNPFAEEGPDLGTRSTKAIADEASGSAEAENARHALRVLSDYRAAQQPQPYYPVVQPAEVRLMWVPDHVNKAGDLVPAHYYYLRVLNDRWAVQDAFELEDQLNVGPKGSGSVPWTYK